MKLFSRLALPGLLLVASSISFASDGSDSGSYNPNYPNRNPFSDNLSDLSKYVLNLGQYFGFNLQQSPSSETPISATLITPPTTLASAYYTLMGTFLGALQVNTAAPNSNQYFIPNTLPNSAINGFANLSFSTSPGSPFYATPSPQQVSVSPLIDQKQGNQASFQADPVSQGILNILTTPDHSFCMTYDGSQWNPSDPSKCQYLFQDKVTTNIVGSIPGTYDFFSYEQNQPLLSQLNTDSLLTPLQYATTQASTGGSVFSSPMPTAAAPGLPAATQAQQASNFIRYVTGSVLPLRLPGLKDYDTLFSQAQNANGTFTLVQQMNAQAILANYLASLRVYAAQSSVALSNLYSIFSKRMPQNTTSGNGASGSNQQQPISQALSEYKMATWRLYNPDPSANSQWTTQINQASPASIQKETAILLAEINYQLYLNRQQQERLLLTNTILMLQAGRQGQPSLSTSVTK